MEHLFWYMVTGACVAACFNGDSELSLKEAIAFTLLWPLVIYWMVTEN
jgi:hypothetical protein